jgi:hypothetical protein
MQNALDLRGSKIKAPQYEYKYRCGPLHTQKGDTIHYAKGRMDAAAGAATAALAASATCGGSAQSRETAWENLGRTIVR